MDKLFLEEVIDRYRHPQYRGHGGGLELYAENVSCGDRITLYLEITNNTRDVPLSGIIKSVKFDGELCSIANYGAELLIDRIIGKNIADISSITSHELLGDFHGGLLTNPVRLKCFELAQVAIVKL